MNNCFVLCEIDDSPRAAFRSTAIGLVLGQLGFRCITIDKSHISTAMVSSLETQSGFKDAQQVAYSHSAMAVLEHASVGDLIILTEPWHQDCFRGLLTLEGGRFHGAPVVEMWIDYPASSAKYRIFSSRYSLACTAALEKQGFTSNWIVASPYLASTAKILTSIHPPVCVNENAPYSMDFLGNCLLGIPVVAPDWGVWSEFIKHGVTGVLYRTPEGKTKAVEKAQLLPSKRIVEALEGWFTLERAAAEVDKYLSRLANG